MTERADCNSISPERRQKILEGLARQLLEPDAGLLVQGVANAYLGTIVMYKRTHKQQLEEASRKRLFTFDLVIPCAPMFKPLVVPFADQSFISAIDPNTFSNLLCCPLFEDVEKSSWYHEMQHDEQQST